jgi:hypothetical protein
MHCSKRASLFDHLVGAGEQRRRHLKAERLRSLQVDHQLVLGRRLHREVSGFLALEDAVDISRRAPMRVDRIGPVGDQASVGGVEPERLHCGQSVSSTQDPSFTPRAAVIGSCCPSAI